MCVFRHYPHLHLMTFDLVTIPVQIHKAPSALWSLLHVRTPVPTVFEVSSAWQALQSSVEFSLPWIRAPSDDNGGIVMGSTRTSDLSAVHFAVCRSPLHSYHTVDDFLVPSVLMLQFPNFSSSEHNICVPNVALCAVASSSSPNPATTSVIHSVPWFFGDSCCRLLFSEWCKLLCGLFSVHAPQVSFF